MVKPIPEGYHSITPYLGVNNGANAIKFYKRAFGAIEEYIHTGIMALMTKVLSTQI
jgi:uncharacterized glyoxalase superfamily protein PhnB